MPSKKTNLQKLQEKIRKEKQKRDKEIKEKKSKVPFAPNINQTKRKNKEEENIRKFFTNLLTVTDENIKQEITNFSNSFKGRNSTITNLLSNILTELPSTYIRSFAQEYTSQDTKNFQDFYSQ